MNAAPLRTDHLDCLLPAVSPATAVVPSGSSRVPASFWFDPFQDLSLVYSADGVGLVATAYGQSNSEGKQACPNQDGVNPYRNRVTLR